MSAMFQRQCKVRVYVRQTTGLENKLVSPQSTQLSPEYSFLAGT